MNELSGYDAEDLQVGMKATFAKTITEADVVMFAGVSGDNNAMHINGEFAAGTQFSGRIAHGTDLCVFDVAPGDGGLVLRELHPGVSLEDVRGKTDCDFRVALPS